MLERADIPSALDIMDVHVRARFTHSEDSRILFINEPGGSKTPAPRFFLGRTSVGNLWRFCSDLPDRICRRLEELCEEEQTIAVGSDELPILRHEYLKVLDEHAPAESWSGGPAYRFTKISITTNSFVRVTEDNSDVLKGGFEGLFDEIPNWQPFVALVNDGQAVSVCRSARVTEAAHEAGVETLRQFRGNGYAGRVTSEWARLVTEGGSIPLYSTSWKNVASQAVARKLGLECFGNDFEIY
jgi:hypothetical protein